MPVYHINHQNRYIYSLNLTFLASVVLVPLALHLASQVIVKQMPLNWSFNLTFTDIVKLLLLATSIVTLSVSLALIIQYHQLTAVLMYKVSCSSSSTQTDIKPNLSPVRLPLINTSPDLVVDPQSDLLLQTPALKSRSKLLSNNTETAI